MIKVHEHHSYDSSSASSFSYPSTSFSDPISLSSAVSLGLWHAAVCISLSLAIYRCCRSGARSLQSSRWLRSDSEQESLLFIISKAPTIVLLVYTFETWQEQQLLVVIPQHSQSSASSNLARCSDSRATPAIFSNSDNSGFSSSLKY